MKASSLLIILAVLLLVPHHALGREETEEVIILDEETSFGETDISDVIDVDYDDLENPYRFKTTDVIAPSLLIGLGIAGLEWKGMKSVNRKLTDALWDDSSHGKIKIDNITEYLPAAAAYGFNLCGVKGLHGYADLTIIMGTAYLMMSAIVYPVKDFVYSPRPGDDPRVNSFPSGHAAWAFTGAEILRREYWHVSPWIGVSGYLIATGTAFLRLYNGAHWLTDVVAGAGIGILCAEAAYWLYPTIARHLFPRQYSSNVFLSPSATRNSFGVAASIVF